ncbi:unnamed protein product [Ostreobium quekettii]|uniref:RWP-RK domain-containing protein n=1 Tax=Ostreobium quekettii TaxID=121088 RepID=A0A8S1ISB1_9CHLO|nr:unnamed protein product [Ostreobium quekettii]
MARVVVDLNNLLADSQSGSLIQIWMPDRENGTAQLQTQGLPYAVTGTGDLLALFRCISCRYHFSTDVMQPKLLGAPGRVYTTLEPEMCNDLQKYHKQIYLRVNEAQRCMVHSTVVMPFFETPTRERPVGVLEVIKTAKNVSFSDLVERLSEALSRVDFYSSDMDSRSLELGLRQWPLDVDNSLVEVARRAQVEELPVDGEEASGTGETEADASPNKLKRNLPKIKRDPSPDADHAGTSKPEKDAPKDVRAEKKEQPMHTTLGLSSSAPNLTAQLDTSRSQADASASMPQVVGGVPCSVNYPFPTYFTPTVAGAGVCYPNGAQHPGMPYMTVPTMQGSMPVMPQFGLNQAELPAAPRIAGPLNPATFNPVNSTQDMASAMLHMQNFQSLLQEMQPGDRRVKSDIRRAKTSMGTGRHLTFDDLKRHMNVGLKEAAAQLGICPTTLKRACRRNGITRWPCRQLAKLNKTMGDMGYKGPPPDDVLESAFRGQLKTSDLPKDLSSTELNTLGEAGGATTQSLDIQDVRRRLADGVSSAPAELNVLAGSSSSHGFLSTVLGEQDYEWTTTGDDADDDIGVDEDEDEPDPNRSAGLQCSAMPGNPEQDAKITVPLSGAATSATMDIPFMAGVSDPQGGVHQGCGGQSRQTIPEGGLMLADFLQDTFDVGHLDRLDIDMPDLGELGQQAS